ncbi:Uncharacterised protein [Chlamydia trachomatis]|nr:Uncharacterised protein [Chlamydia trachomatis]CRH48795.1 Uncharacterised protein [Chlamydia trachomatis]
MLVQDKFSLVNTPAPESVAMLLTKSIVPVIPVMVKDFSV